MKVLLYGSKGWIGGMVVKQLQQEIIEFVEGSVHVEKVKDLEDEIVRVQPTHIISTIGRTHGTHNGKVYGTIDYLEQPGKLVENVRDNLFSPVLLSLLAKKHNYHFTYLATGCIYQFDEEHPYEQEVNGFDEYSLPNFFGSSYSIVKGFTDQLMNFFEDNTLTLKIRMPIVSDVNPRNFITKIVNYEKVCSIKNSMSVLDELIPIMVDMVRKNHVGKFNFTNPGLISHNEILEMYKEIVDPNFTWQNFTIEEQNKILDSGRSNNYLDTSKLEALYPDIKNIKEMVRETLVKMAEKVNSQV